MEEAFIEPQTPTLDLLPTEILLHIFSFLSVKNLLLNVFCVCRRFRNILNDETVWKWSIKKRYNRNYPIVPQKRTNWTKASYRLDKEWSSWKTNVNYVIADGIHAGAVDSVVFVNKSVCVSGSRDRSLVIWNPNQSTNFKRCSYVLQKNDAHEGWIWRLRYRNGNLHSCSWDNTVKIWDLKSNALKLKSTFRCSSPVLSMTVMDDVIFAGDYGKTIYAFDPRCDEEPIFSYRVHRRPVLTLGCTNTEVISGSEDKTLAVWDIRKKATIQKISFTKYFPNSLSIYEDTLYIGDSRGNVKVFHIRNSHLKLTACFNIGHKKAVTIVKHEPEYLLTGSLDATVKISLPTRPPKMAASVKTRRGEICGADYCEGILAVGGAGCVEFWKPAGNSRI